jgi:hypothetical protein
VVILTVGWEEVAVATESHQIIAISSHPTRKVKQFATQ